MPAAQRWARRIALVIWGVLVLMIAAWVLGDPSENLATDWTSFDNAASRLLSGEEIYRRWDAEAEPLPYLYPPFVLWLALPLGLVGFYGSWLMSSVFTAVTFGLGMHFGVRAACPNDGVERTTAWILATACGTFASAVLIGQYSGIYVLAVGLAMFLWKQDRLLLAGLALGLLMIKPNIGIAVPVVLVWSRSWRPLLGFVSGTCALLVLSLPFGLNQWSEFVANARHIADLQSGENYPDEKMVTVVSGFQTWTGLDARAFWPLVVWLLATAVVGVAVLAVWRKELVAASPARALGALSIFVVVANPRMFFYDASLIAIGMAALWLVRDLYSPVGRRWITVSALALWLLSWGGAFDVLNPFVGVAGAAVVVGVAVETRRTDMQSGEREFRATDAVAADGAAEMPYAA